MEALIESSGRVHVKRLALCWAAATSTVLSLASELRASENYPGIVDRHAGVECPRPLTRCLICHDTAAGGEETANQPFAVSLVETYGLPGGESGRELARALQALPDDVDTDGDGMPDQAELSACMNPSGEELSEGPGFGCVASIGSTHPVTGGALGAAMGLVVVLALTRALRKP